MARIAGVDLPRNKRIEVGLTYIFGVGRSRSKSILKAIQIDKDKKTDQLSEEEVAKIRDYLEKNFDVEGELDSSVLRGVTGGQVERLLIWCFVRNWVTGCPVQTPYRNKL